MSFLLTLAYLFFIGSIFGWVLELLWRNLTQRNKKWINPGFCTGPYLPIYGIGLCGLYLLASLDQFLGGMSPVGSKILLLLTMAVGMTLIEYIAGVFCLKYLKVRLWDYSNCWGNIQGIICPLFSFFWAILGAIYYFAIHPYILSGLDWLSRNLAFSFFIGVFFGVFLIDVVHSAHLIVKLKQFADDHSIVLAYERVKDHIHTYQQEHSEKYHFFSPFRSGKTLAEHLQDILKKRTNETKTSAQEKT